WFQQKAMKVAQPDIARCGITGGIKIVEAARKNGLVIAPHIGVCTAIGVAATWHVSSVYSEGTSQEHELDMFEIANRLLKAPLKVEKGKAIVPSGVGLGIEVDEEFIRKHSPGYWSISGD